MPLRTRTLSGSSAGGGSSTSEAPSGPPNAAILATPCLVRTQIVPAPSSASARTESCGRPSLFVRLLNSRPSYRLTP